MLATREKDSQALSLLPSPNSADGVLWVELMQQLPPFSNRKKEKCCTITHLKKKNLLLGQRETVGQLAAFEPLTVQVCQQVRQLCKPLVAIGAGWNFLTFINLIYGYVFPSHPLPSLQPHAPVF